MSETKEKKCKRFIALDFAAIFSKIDDISRLVKFYKKNPWEFDQHTDSLKSKIKGSIDEVDRRIDKIKIWRERLQNAEK